MSSFVIPVRVLAVAACEAATTHEEDPADAFDDSKPSRARWTAIEVIRLIYPTSSQISIARHFGCEGDSKEIAKRMQGARLSNWWNQDAVCMIAARIAPHSAIVNASEPRVEIQEDMVARVSFKPRPRGTPIAQIRNVTAALMGDPPAGRREMMAATLHGNFAAVGDPRPSSRGTAR